MADLGVRQGIVFSLLIGFTALPVYAKTFYIPHFADGAGFSMLLSVNNPGRSAATGTVTAYDLTGTPQVLPFNTGSASQVPLTLAPNSTQVLTTNGSSIPARAGYLVVDADQDAVTAVAIFRGAGFEASVLPTTPGKKFAVFVERSAALDTGISIVKLAETTTVNLTVYDTAGAVTASRPYAFSGRKDAKFFGELFAGLPANFQGLLLMEASAEIAPIGLRFGGGVLSTVPVAGLDQPGPAILVLSPASGAQGQTIGNFTVFGANFQASSTLSFSGSGITVNSYSSRTATRIVASITIAGNAATGPRDATVTNPDSGQSTSAGGFSVTALQLPAIVVSPASLDFPGVGLSQSMELPLSVQNTGPGLLTVTGITVSTRTFTITSPATPFNVPSGNIQIVVVRFTPTGPGVEGGTLTVASNDPSQPAVQVLLSGTGQSTGSSPAISSVTVARDASQNGLIHVVSLSDLDADIVRIHFDWYSLGSIVASDFSFSTTNFNLSGRTSGTLTLGIRFPSSVPVASLTRVDVQAIDSKGNRSSVFIRTF